MNALRSFSERHRVKISSNWSTTSRTVPVPYASTNAALPGPGSVVTLQVVHQCGHRGQRLLVAGQAVCQLPQRMRAGRQDQVQPVLTARYWLCFFPKCLTCISAGISPARTSEDLPSPRPHDRQEGLLFQSLDQLHRQSRRPKNSQHPQYRNTPALYRALT